MVTGNYKALKMGSESDNSLISNNIFIDNGVATMALWLWESRNITIRNNIIDNNVLENSLGICLDSSTGNDLMDNNVRGNLHGFHIIQSSENNITDNIINANGKGIYLAGDTLGAFSGVNASGSGRYFVVKYDGSGQETWSRQFDASIGDAYTTIGIAADTSGVYLVGSSGDRSFPGQTNAGGSSVLTDA
jgi:parallel beta-helix repeat protein